MIENFVTEKGVKTAANLLGPLGPTVSQLLPDNPAVSLKKALEKKDPMVKEAAAFLYSQQTGQELTYAQEYWLRTHPKSVEAATSIIKSLKKGKK
jgi:hypothetical protein